MIEALAARLARGLNRYTGNAKISVDFVRYRFAELLNGGIIIAVSVLIGLWTGTLLPTVMALMAFYTIRRLTGGFHLPLDWCAIASIGCIVLIVHTNAGPAPVLNGLALACYALFAERGWRRWAALVWTASNYFIGSDLLARCFLLQGLTLLNRKGGESNAETVGRLVGKAFGNKCKKLKHR